MRTFHVVAGVVGLLAGTMALYAVKGRRLHRLSGITFVVAMLAMSLTGIVMALGKGPDANAIGGITAAYLVITALTTVRPRSVLTRRIDFSAMLAATAVAGLSLFLALILIASSRRSINGIPAPAFLMFAAVCLIGAAGDLRVLRSGPLRGSPRLVRHLWRMCWALWIGVSSFFLGPRTRVEMVLPAALTSMPFRVVPVVAVLVVMVYWIWRLRRARRGGPAIRSLAGNETAEPLGDQIRVAR